MSNTDSQRLDAMRRQRDGYQNQLRKTDIDRLRAQVDASILRAALVAIQELHGGFDALMNPGRNERLVKVCTGCGTDDGNWQRWPCPTRRLADEALGDDVA